MRYNRIDRIITESIKRVIREIDEPAPTDIGGNPGIDIEAVLNNLPEPDGKGVGGKGTYKRFAASLNYGLYDRQIYKNPGSFDKQIKSMLNPSFQMKGFRAIRERYKMLHEKYPEGFPVLSPEREEEERLARKYRKNIEKGSYDDRFYYNGVKFLKYIEKNFPNEPWLIDIAKQRLSFVNRTYINDEPPYESMPY